MRYRNFIWPHNPRIYSIDFERHVAVQKVPFGTYYLQDLGRSRRVMRGEGEFVGRDAYAQFGQLANTFYEEGPGTLIHPLWQTASAYFMQLRLEQEPRPDYVRYSFAFWEADPAYSGKVQEISPGAAGEEGAGGETDPRAGRGATGARRGTPWGRYHRRGGDLQEVIRLNPQIKNPNLIYPGDEVRVG